MRRAALCAIACLLMADAGGAQEAPRACDEPVVIKGARSTSAGTAAQRNWIRRNHKGARIVASAIVRERGRTFDVMTIAPPGAANLDVCFDVTAYFGMW